MGHRAPPKAFASACEEAMASVSRFLRLDSRLNVTITLFGVSRKLGLVTC
jgi:hypothetical protein